MNQYRVMMKSNTQPLKFKKVMIIDDHPLYSSALAEVLKIEIGAEQIHLANSLEDACQILVKRIAPKIVFLDLNLPDATGMSGLIHLRNRIDEVPIVIISASSNAEIVQAARDAGAAGFICKNISREMLAEQLHRLCNGENIFPIMGVKSRASSPNISDISTRLAKLTPQQRRILQMICQGKLNKQIAFDLNLAEATVKTHITAMMRKLSVQNRTQAALLIREVSVAVALE